MRQTGCGMRRGQMLWRRRKRRWVSLLWLKSTQQTIATHRAPGTLVQSLVMADRDAVQHPWAYRLHRHSNNPIRYRRVFGITHKVAVVRLHSLQFRWLQRTLLQAVLQQVGVDGNHSPAHIVARNFKRHLRAWLLVAVTHCSKVLRLRRNPHRRSAAHQRRNPEVIGERAPLRREVLLGDEKEPCTHPECQRRASHHGQGDAEHARTKMQAHKPADKNDHLSVNPPPSTWPRSPPAIYCH